MNTQQQPCVILAVNTITQSTDETFIEQGLTKRPIKHLTGCYKGTTERSYLIPLTHGLLLADCTAFAKEHNQESILYLDNQRNAYLVYCDKDQSEYLGTFTAVSRDRATGGDAWTYDPITKQYYMVVI